jgi:hypothetical protein
MGRPACLLPLGSRFGRLTVAERVVVINSHQTNWLCHCDCGTITVVPSTRLVRGDTQSCGCLSREQTGTRRRTHGQSKSPLYFTWNTMRRRCSDPHVASYSRYGGRGIFVCDAWQQFVPFQEWALAHGYQRGLQIDRIDNNGPYSPANCHFVTAKVNSQNRRRAALYDRETSPRLTAFGETKTFKGWSRDPRCVVSYTTLRARILARYWPAEIAITAAASWMPLHQRGVA